MIDDQGRPVEGSAALPRLDASPQLGELATALAKAQQQISHAVKAAEGQVGSRKYKYATLEAVTDACRGPLNENGLSIVQTASVGPDGLYTLDTVLLHTSGQWMRSRLFLVPNDDPQVMGSQLTYLRRYGLSAMVWVVVEDDDAAAAAAASSSRAAQPVTREKTKPAPSKPAPKAASSGNAEQRRTPNSPLSEAQKKLLWAQASKTCEATGVSTRKIITDCLERLGLTPQGSEEISLKEAFERGVRQKDMDSMLDAIEKYEPSPEDSPS